MTGTVTDRARRLAAELERLFAGDAESAKRLNDAHQRLTAANEQLWTGPHPKRLTAGCGDHPEFETIQLEAALNSRFEILESADALGQLQQRTGRSTRRTSITTRPLRTADGSRPISGEVIARSVERACRRGLGPRKIAGNADVLALTARERGGAAS